MDVSARRELANAILTTARVRESSWDSDRYHLTFAEAADQIGVDPDLAPLVVAMLASGFCDFPEWADRIVAAAHRAPVTGA